MSSCPRSRYGTVSSPLAELYFSLPLGSLKDVDMKDESPSPWLVRLADLGYFLHFLSIAKSTEW